MTHLRLESVSIRIEREQDLLADFTEKVLVLMFSKEKLTGDIFRSLSNIKLDYMLWKK
jgi:hypothetical protein